jgi:four helix bundle protein
VLAYQISLNDYFLIKIDFISYLFCYKLLIVKMMTIRRFEELEVWKNARELCRKIREIVNSTRLGSDFRLRDQVLSSSGSVMDNIAEGFERDGKKEFIQFLYIAKGSLGETRSQVHLISDSGYIENPVYERLLNDCSNLSAQLTNFINYLYKTEIEGKKQRKNSNPHP